MANRVAGSRSLFPRAEFEFIAVDRKQAYLAREACSRHGKGPHRAGLNFGDCFSYAQVMFLGEA